MIVILRSEQQCADEAQAEGGNQAGSI